MHALVNGDSVSSPSIEMRVGETHRFRFINIGAAAVFPFTIKRDTAFAEWRAIAKDGADLPAVQRTVRKAELFIDVARRTTSSSPLPRLASTCSPCPRVPTASSGRGRSSCDDGAGQHLCAIDRRQFGMPRRLLVDNGSPWGSAGSDARYTALTVWLMRIGITVVHSRPYHPQTLGKDERFHRTLKAEVLQYCSQLSTLSCQKRFDEWRNIYNYERPHESLHMEVPGRRYQASTRSYVEKLLPIEYELDDTIREVHQGRISLHCRRFRIGKAFNSEYIALRPTSVDGVYDVMFCDHKIDEFDVRSHN